MGCVLWDFSHSFGNSYFHWWILESFSQITTVFIKKNMLVSLCFTISQNVFSQNFTQNIIIIHSNHYCFVKNKFIHVFLALHKIPWYYVIFWSRNCVKEIGKISVFCVVSILTLIQNQCKFLHSVIQILQRKFSSSPNSQKTCLGF